VFGVSLFVAISLVVMMIRRKLQKRAAAAGIPVDIDEPERDETTS
jgi:hypothetical protein